MSKNYANQFGKPYQPYFDVDVHLFNNILSQNMFHLVHHCGYLYPDTWLVVSKMDDDFAVLELVEFCRADVEKFVGEALFTNWQLGINDIQYEIWHLVDMPAPIMEYDEHPCITWLDGNEIEDLYMVALDNDVFPFAQPWIAVLVDSDGNEYIPFDFQTIQPASLRDVLLSGIPFVSVEEYAFC